MPHPSNSDVGLTPDGLPAANTAPQPPISNADLNASSQPSSQGEIASAAIVAPAITNNDQTEHTADDLMGQFEAATNFTTPTVKPTSTPKVADKNATPVTAANSDAQQSQVQVANQARNYEALPPEIREHAKKMSNEAFNATRDFLARQTADLTTTKQQLTDAQKGTIPASYLEHPDAYTLTPEYNQASSAAQDAAAIFQHWQQQLNEVRSGALEYKPLQRGQDGKMYYGTPIKADANTETQLLAMFNAAQNQAMQFQSKMETVKSSYVAKHAEAKGWLSNLESSSYQAFNDPANPLSAAYKQTLEQFPPTYRGNPLASLLAKSMVANGQLLQMIQKGQVAGNGTANTATTTTTPVARQNPNLNDIGGDGITPKAAAENITFDDFEKAKW